MVEGFHIFDHKTIIATSPLVDTISSNQSVDTQIQVRKLLKPFQLYLISFSFFKKIFPRLYKEFIYFNYMPFSNKYFICDTINGAAFMISKKFIDSINYFDQNVFLYHEELILGKQIKNCGGECLLNGFIEVKHIQGSSTKSTPLNFNLAMERYKYISEAYFFKQYLDVKDIYIKIFCGLKKLELGIKKFIFSFR